METEALQEADSQRKNQRPGKGKRQCTVVDLLFAFIIRPESATETELPLLLPERTDRVGACGKAEFCRGHLDSSSQHRFQFGWKLSASD